MKQPLLHHRRRGRHLCRASKRIGPLLLHRAVGAVQLLRHAGDPRALLRSACGTGRTRIRRQARCVDLRHVHDVCLPDRASRWSCSRRSYWRKICSVSAESIIAFGHFSMVFRSMTFFYLGMVLIALGTGLLKPNISAMVGNLYSEDDPRRDSGFSIFYMGINIGAVLAPLLADTSPRAKVSSGSSLRWVLLRPELALGIRRRRRRDDLRPHSLSQESCKTRERRQLSKTVRRAKQKRPRPPKLCSLRYQPAIGNASAQSLSSSSSRCSSGPPTNRRAQLKPLRPQTRQTRGYSAEIPGADCSR